MKRTLSLLVIAANLLLLRQTLMAQETTRAYQLPSRPTCYEADASGDFYLGFPDGQVRKFQKDGKELENFSLPNNSSILQIDTQNRLKPFLFQFDIQRITVLDRFSAVPKVYPLSEFGISLATMACPSPDGDFWILENNPTRLIKYNPLRKIKVLEIQPDLGDSTLRMKAYQNILLIADKSGLHAYDIFGAAVYKLAMKEIVNIQLVKNEIFLFTTHEVKVIDPFSGEIKKSLAAPTKKTVLKLPSYWVTLKNKEMLLHKLD